MAKYNIKAPDGRTYNIEGPEGASDDDIIGAVISQYPDATKPDPLGQAVAGTRDAVQDDRPSSQSAEYNPQGDFSLADAYKHAEERGGGYGIDPAAKEAISGGHTYTPTGLLANAIDYGATGVQALGYGIDALAQGADRVARNVLGKDTEFLPGSGIMALQEAFPAGGAEAGIVHPGIPGKAGAVEGAAEAPPAPRLPPAVEAGWTDVLGKGTIEDAMRYSIEHKINVNPDDVIHYITKRDAGEAQPAAAVYKNEVAPAETALKGEADAFQPRREPTAEDVFPSPAAKEAAMTDKLQAEADAFQKSREPTAPVETPQRVNDIVDHVNKVAEDWQNAPDTQVHNNFDNVEGVDKNALGVYDAETGQVHLNSEAIEREATHRGVSPQEMTNTVMFHEGLGHYGLAQHFREGLDDTLNHWDKNSNYFKKQIDNWLEQNPEAYADEANRRARAGEEVLAEMSERGKMPSKLLDTVKNQVKGYARRMGLNLDYSAREIKTILAQSHDAVIAGKGGDVVGNGFRSMKEGRYTQDDIAWYSALAEKAQNADRLKTARRLMDESRRQQVRENLPNRNRYMRTAPDLPEGFKNPTPEEIVKNRNESKILDKVARYHDNNAEIGKTTFTQPYKNEPDIYSFSYTRDDGRPVSGSYKKVGDTVKDFSIGLVNGDPHDIGPTAVRQIAKAIRKEHPDVTRLEAERISGARIASGKGREPIEVSMARYMKSTYGKSEGQLQGKAAMENPEESTVINKLRSTRNVDEIFKEAAPEKDKQTWGEWANAAERLNMTDKMARNIAAGADVPQLKAAEMHALKLANSIHDLSKKAADGTLSPKETDLLRQWSKSFEETNQAISDVVANAARILNSRNMEVATDATLSQRVLRRMLSTMTEAEREALGTPEGAAKFAKKLVKAEKNAVRVEKSVQVMGNIMNFTRSIWSSLDLSAPFRQGRALAHTGEFWKGIPAMFKYWGSKPFYEATMKSISDRPTFERMQKAGLAFTDLGADLSKREEQFMSSWAGKLPGVKQSERAYNGYLNKLRADVFDRLSKEMEDAGVNLKTDTKTLKDLGRFVNTATGRGDLGRLNQAAPLLASTLFSPRLMAARVNMLNPMYYAKLSKPVRRQAIKGLLAFGVTSVIATKLLQTAGAKVEWDPRSSNFMKLRVGDTRYDTGGGFYQYLTLAARLATNQTKNAKGDVVNLGERFGSKDSLDVLKDFMRSKLSPNASLIVDARLGKNVVGEKFDPENEAVKRFIPLFFQDAADVIKEKGPVEGTIAAAPGLFGIGTQTYPSPTGTDEYGRSYTTEREDTPAITEVKRLGGVRAPNKSIMVDGKSEKLPDDVYQRYSELSGKHFTESMEKLYDLPQFKSADDDTKKEVIRELHAEAKKMAREEMLGEAPDDETNVENEGEVSE